MFSVCNLSGIIDVLRPAQGIADVKNVGFNQVMIEIDFRHIQEECQEVDDYGPYIKKYYTRLLDKCNSECIGVYAIRLNYRFGASLPSCSKISLLEIVSASLSALGTMPCDFLILDIQDTGYAKRGESCLTQEECICIANEVKERNTLILFENQYHDFNGNFIRGSFSDASYTRNFIDELNRLAGFERFGLCMNVGTFTLCGQNMQEYASSLGERIKSVILRDCDGIRDASLLPFTSSSGGQSHTDWLSLIRGLREIAFNGGLILDMKDTAASFSTLLRPHLMPLAKETAVYFRWQIELESILQKNKHIVLFGAGNMCRNYMKCYGEKYKPLYTCDNKNELWGTEFCGLEVKSPEALKSLPQNCAIVICNIYYREIEAQIRNMGVSNSIEYFNDEYMPVFHFNRLTRGV